MKVRRLRWHGAARRHALVERLRPELGAWLDDWSVDPALLSVRLVDEGEPLPTGWRWMEAASRHGAILLGARGKELDGLGGLLAKAEREDALKLGFRVGHRALRALMARLAGAAAEPVEARTGDEPGADRLAAKFGCVVLALSGPDFDARLIVDNELFEYWVPPAKAALSPLVPRDAAVGGESVTLRVMLDLGPGQLADAQGLRVGDVLVSGTSINNPFELVSPDARRLLAAHLLRRGDRRAVQIEASIPGKTP